MYIIIRIFYKDEVFMNFKSKPYTGRSVQANMLFNTVGSIIYYFCIWLSSVLIVRMSGYADAGIFSVAMTVTASPAIFGLFNVRAYQVSDLKGEYSDHTYIISRIWTNIFSLFICVILAVIYGYGTQPGKMAVILAYMILKMSEAGADVYYGIYQKKARLDYAGISLTIRGVGSIATFVIVYEISKNLLLAVLLMSLFSVLVVLCYDMRIVRRFIEPEKPGQKPDFKTVMQLIVRCVPLALVAFLNNLSLTVPRTYLEKFHGADVMGYYASVSSPTMVIQLAAVTLFAPLVPIITERFLEGDKKGFLKILGKFGVLMAALTGVAVILSIFLADWALQLVFGAGIAPYTYLFTPIMLSAALIAVNASLFSICTLMRIIKSQYIIGVAGIGVAILVAFTWVKTMSMTGVIMGLFATLLVQIAIQIVLIANGVRKMTPVAE